MVPINGLGSAVDFEGLMKSCELENPQSNLFREQLITVNNLIEASRIHCEVDPEGVFMVKRHMGKKNGPPISTSKVERANPKLLLQNP